VSENKPVGSTAAEGDLMGGDDIISVGSGAPTTTNGQPKALAQSNQDLLAEIFGSSPLTTSPQVSQQQQRKSTMDDILGLFGSTNLASSPAPSSSFTTSPPPVTNPLSSFLSNSSSTHSSSPVQSPPTMPSLSTATPAAPPAAAVVKTAPRLTAYTAYEKNDLKITLTPQTSAAKPGIVMILAKFSVQNSSGASGINFQAAVPKVCQGFLSRAARKCGNTDDLMNSHNSYKCFPCRIQMWNLE